MRTIILFALLFLVFCASCSKEVSLPDKGNTTGTVETTDPNSEPPLVEPMFYPDGSQVNPTEEQPVKDVPDTTGIFSEALGKYGAEVVPLPPLADLTAQVDEYITSIGKFLEDLDGSPKYVDDAANIVRDVHALALVVHAIGLAEADSKYKKPAAPIITSAKVLAIAKNFAEGQERYEKLKTSLTSAGNGDSLSWAERVADLAPAMKALPNLSSAVKRRSDTERKLNLALERQPHQVYGALAAMAVIAQGTIPNVAETPKPDAEAEWKKLCEEFRDAALQANAAAHQYAKDKEDGKEPNYALFDASFKAMSASCDDCHKVFYPSAVGKKE